MSIRFDSERYNLTLYPTSEDPLRSNMTERHRRPQLLNLKYTPS